MIRQKKLILYWFQDAQTGAGMSGSGTGTQSKNSIRMKQAFIIC